MTLFAGILIGAAIVGVPAGIFLYKFTKSMDRMFG